MEFHYAMPTRIISGCVTKYSNEIKPFGKKALVVTGKNSARICGALDDCIVALTTNGQAYAVFDRVMNNPSVECVFEGARVAQQEGCDFIFAIGGGSPLDAAKAIALVAVDERITPENLFGFSFERALPVIAIPTTAGTGSEVTQYAVLTDHKQQTKRSIASPLVFPSLTFLDAAYTKALPVPITTNTAIDALSHSIEGMLSVRASLISDCLAKQSIAMIASCFGALTQGRVSQQDRETLLLASTLAGMVIANTGTTAVHSMGYSLTYHKNIDHGRANGLLLPAFLEVLSRTEKEKIDEILACMGMNTTDQFAKAMSELLGERETLSLEEITAYSAVAAKAKNIANCIVRLSEEEIIHIFTSSLPSTAC